MLKTGQVTIKDIARELNVSPSTVSRALKDHPDISPSTKKAVNELAGRLDYQPNAIALSLRKSKTNIIGVVIPQIVHHFFSTVISGIEDVANEHGYHVMICQSNESFDREKSSTQALLNSRVDGMLVSIASATQNYEHFENLLRRNIPLVFFDRVQANLDTSKVVVDDHDGAYRATEHLIEVGCKNIAHLAGPSHLSISNERKQGYIDALEKQGMSINEDLIIACELSQEEGYKAAKTLLQKKNRPDAIFAATDPLAIGAILAAKELGISIPQELALVGFSDEPLTSLIEPSLSTMAQPGYEMGKHAAELFLRQMEDKDNFVPETKVLKTRLIQRDSSRRVSK